MQMDRPITVCKARKSRLSDWYGYADIRLISQMFIRYGIVTNDYDNRFSGCTFRAYTSDVKSEEFRLACYKLKCIYGIEIET